MKKILSSIIALLLVSSLFSQKVGIGTTTPDPSAALDVTSTTQGMLVPRMTSAQRTAISNAANGLLVFDVTTNSFWFKGNSTWIQLVDSVHAEVHRVPGNKLYMGMTDNVGIGTSTPNYKLEVKTPTYNYGIAHTDGLVTLATYIDQFAGWIGTKTNQPLKLFANDGFNQFVLTQAGNVGIGYGSPGFKLNFAPVIGDKISLYGNVGAHYGFGIASNLMQIHTDAVNSGIGFGYGSSDAFTENVRISGDGKVGIGVIPPNNSLDINIGSNRTGSHPTGLPLYITGDVLGNSNGVEFRHTNGTQGLGFGFNTVYAAGSNISQDIGLAAKGVTGQVKFATNGLDRAWINGSGYMGIGVSPSNQIDIHAGVSRTGSHPTGLAMYVTGDMDPAYWGFEIRKNNGTQGIGIGYNTIYAAGSDVDQDLRLASRGFGGSMVLSTNGAEKMRITGTGYFGIGTQVPNQKFSILNKFGVDLNGSIHFSGVPRQIYFYDGGTPPNVMVLSHSPAYPTWGLQYTATNKFRFLKDSAQIMAVDLQNNAVEVNGTLKIGHHVVESAPVSVSAGNGVAQICNCPAGEVVLSGGYWTNYANGFDISMDAPDPTGGGWVVYYYNSGGGEKLLKVFAVCARLGN